MRGTMPADVAAERQLTVVERLHVLLPRSRGFRVSADGSVSVYLASSRARRLPAAKQEGSALGGEGHGLWLVVEGVQHLRRGDLPAQPVARRLENGVGVVLVDAPHGQAPAQQLHGEGLWAGL